VAVTIRPEEPADIAAVRSLNEAAFGQETEAAIVDGIRAGCGEALSLVAVDGGEVLGHILFSPVVVSGDGEAVRGMGLGPMAVAPDRQREGIGALLVRAGIEEMRRLDCPFLIVLGHPEYYRRFSFLPASRHGLRCQWKGVPDQAFMVLPLDLGRMAGVSGVVHYRREFDQAM
jgi:putative acetyltransferase